MIEQVLRLINLKKWIGYRENQYTLCSMNTCHANNAPGYINEIFSHAECNWIPTCCSYPKFLLPHRKKRFKSFVIYWSFIQEQPWKVFETSVSLNAFKHNWKVCYFRKGNKKEWKVIRIIKPYISIASKLLFYFVYFYTYLFIYFRYLLL